MNHSRRPLGNTQLIILAVLLFMPNGLFGKRGTERV